MIYIWVSLIRKLVLLMVSNLSVFYDEMVLMPSNYVCRKIIITVR